MVLGDNLVQPLKGQAASGTKSISKKKTELYFCILEVKEWFDILVQSLFHVIEGKEAEFRQRTVFAV